MGKYLLGLSNGWVVKRFSEPEVWTELLATKLEVDMVQFSFDLLDPSVDKQVSNEIITRTLDSCRRYGVRLQSCFTGAIAYNSNLLLHPFPAMRRYAFNWYSRAIDICSKLHVEDLGGHMGSLTVSDYKNPQRRDTLLSDQFQHVLELGKLCCESGLSTLLWEIMPISREPPSTISEARDLMQRLKREPVPIKLCIDVGHTCNPHAKDAHERDPYTWLRELGAESPCVHVQQTDGKGDRHWPFTKKFNKIGIIRGEKILSCLDESGADRTYVFPEVFPAFEQDDDQVIDDIAQTVRYWKEFV